MKKSILLGGQGCRDDDARYRIVYYEDTDPVCSWKYREHTKEAY